MQPIINSKSITEIPLVEEKSLTRSFWNWRIYQSIYPVLCIIDAFYQFLSLSSPSFQIFQENSPLISLTKLLSSILVLFIWQGISGRAIARTNTEIRYPERFLLTLFYIYYVLAEKKTFKENWVNYYGGLEAEFRFLEVGMGYLWKMLMFDYCAVNPFLKLVYTLINLSTLFLVFRIHFIFFFNTRIFCMMMLICGVICYTWKSYKQGLVNENAEGRNKTFERILSFLPEGVLVLDSTARVKFVNNYMHNIFDFYEISSSIGVNSEFSRIKLSEPMVHVANASQASKGNSPKNFQEPQTCPHKSRLINQTHQVETLAGLTQILLTDDANSKALEKYILTFQAKYQKFPSYQEGIALEIKVNFFTKNNGEKFLILLFHDATDRQRIVSLENENNIYRNNLIASFSHELRTPLNGTLAFIEQAMEESTGVTLEVKEKLLKPALISGKFLLSIVNDILDYSQIILNKLKLDIQPKSLVQTIDVCVDLFREKLDQKGIEFKLKVNHPNVSDIYTDHKRVSQILVNLLSNAVRFTTKGFIEIRLTTTAESNVLLVVKDTGIGMNEIVQNKLRKKLIDGEIKGKVDNDSAGIGLGLFISNALAKLLSSNKRPGLEFYSCKGKGSEFLFEIENRKPAGALQLTNGEDDMFENCSFNKVLITEYSPNPGRRARNRTTMQDDSIMPSVLIVDDEVFNIMVIENFCKTKNIATERAFDGKEAIHKIKSSIKDGESSFKVIFMDVNMPVMDGYETTHEIQNMVKDKKMGNVVVIGVTAYVSQEMIDKCYESGMSEVLNKPLSKEMIDSVLKKFPI